MGTSGWENNADLSDAVVTAVAYCLCQQHARFAKWAPPDRDVATSAPTESPCDWCRHLADELLCDGLAELLGVHGGFLYEWGRLAMPESEATAGAFEAMVEHLQEIREAKRRRAERRGKRWWLLPPDDDERCSLSDGDEVTCSPGSEAPKVP